MIISILNHKGGTGKTTTAVNLGRALSDKDLSVLLVDFDSQANLSYSLGINSLEYTIEDVVLSGNQLDEFLMQREGLSVLPNSSERSFKNQVGLEDPWSLDKKLKTIQHYFDFVLIDCPPTVSNSVLNALLASDRVLIPFQLDVLSVEGMTQVLSSIRSVKTQYQKSIEILGILPINVDRRRALTHEVLNHIRQNYHIHVFDSMVRSNVKIAEAPSFGQSVIEYDPNSNGAQDYQLVADEFINIIQRAEKVALT